MPLPTALFYGFAFLWGAVWGSFFNVCIYRIPAGLSVVKPASRCPVCEKELKAWHNVPILSWLLLRGRCAYCGVSIPARYALVELLTAMVSLALFHRWWTFALAASADGELVATGSVLIPFFVQFLFVSALIVVTFIDIDHMIIPNAITLPGTLIGVALSFAAWPETGVLWWHSALGAFIGGGVLLGVIWGYFRLTGREGMGLGDFKLMAMVGAFLGVQALPFVLFASAIQGLLYAVSLFVVGGGEQHREQLAALDAEEAAEAAAAALAAGEEPPAAPTPSEDDDEDEGALERFRTMPIPYGPFIALGAVEWVFFQEPIQAFLESWLG